MKHASRAFAPFRVPPSNTHIAEIPLSSNSFAILYQPNTCGKSPYPCEKCKRWVIRVPSLEEKGLNLGKGEETFQNSHDNLLALDALKTIW